ncbi:MAG: membrane protein insertion efficiency factor YidD [Thermodesulfobacteriota bacterium]
MSLLPPRPLPLCTVVWLALFLSFLSHPSFAGDPHPAPPENNPGLLSLSINVYQKILSPVLASECYMKPSCSNYSREAFSEYGNLLGLLLTIDRLFREADEDKTSPLIKEGMFFKLFDPPSDNLWWKQ